MYDYGVYAFIWMFDCREPIKYIHPTIRSYVLEGQLCEFIY